jgi:hypothetical protein
MKAVQKKTGWIKWILMVFVSIVMLLFMSLIVYSTFYSDDLNKRIVNQINKNITAQISVSHTRFWFIKYFPNATITFYNVKISNKEKLVDNKILDIKELSIKFNLIELLKGNYVIQGIVVKDGTINYRIDKYGKTNYDIWKSDGSKSGKVTLQINKVLIYNIKAEYNNAYNDINIETNVRKLKMVCNQQGENFNFKLNTTLNNTFYNSLKLQYKITDEINIYSYFRSNKDRLKIIDGKLEILNQNIFVDGEIAYIKPYPYSFSIESDNLDIVLLLKKFNIEIPKELVLRKANCKIKSNLNGKFDLKQAQINAIVDTKIVILEYKKLKTNLNKTQFKVIINPISRVYSIESDNISGSFLDSEFKIAGLYKSSDKKNIEVNGLIIMNYNDINKFVSNKNIVFSDGNVKIVFNAKTKDSIVSKDLRSINEFDYRAVINTDSLSFVYENNYNVSKLNGKFILDNKNLIINELECIINNSDLNISGNISNVFFDSENTNSSGRSELIVKSNLLDLNKLYYKSDSTSLGFPLYLKVNLIANEIKYKQFIINKINVDLKSEKNKISASNVKFRLLNGNLSDGNFLLINNTNTLDLFISFDIKNVSIKDVFYSFNNFEQDYIKYNNLNGNLSGNGSFKCSFDAENKLIENSVNSEMNIKINEGVLYDVMVQKKLFSYLKMNNIKELKFSELKNNVVINKGNIYISPMYVTTNAINFEVSGTHNLENEYEYHFKLSLSDLLRKRMKNDEIDDFPYKTEKDTTRKIYVFVTLKGKGEEYTFAYDNKQAVNSFVTKLKNEKSEIKDLVKMEFGIIKKDATKIKRNKRPLIENQLIKEDSIFKVKKTDVVKKKQKIEWKDE